MIGRPEYTLTLPPPCPTNRDHLRAVLLGLCHFRVNALPEPVPFSIDTTATGWKLDGLRSNIR